MRSYRSAIDRFFLDFGESEIDELTPDDIFSFLNSFTNGNKPYTKRVRYSHLSTFFNFFRNNVDPGIGNPCDTPMIRKLYRERVRSRWEIIEKETVDEIIFRTRKVRNQLILELMARGGMRIGEVLKLRVFLTSGSLESKITYYPSNREKSAFCTNYDNYADAT